MQELLNPYVDENGKLWFDLTSAAERLHYAATPPTLARWAEQGRASFGLPIESKRIPLKMRSHITPGTSYKPRFPRTDRPVISENTVNALNAVFTEVFTRRRKHDNYSKEQLTKLKTAASRYLSEQTSTLHL